jgi:hypothetical protein
MIVGGGLDGEALGLGLTERREQAALERGDGGGRAGAQALREAADARESGVDVGDGLVHEADAQRLVGVDLLAGAAEAQRVGGADVERELGGPAGAGEDPQAGLGQGEASGRGRQTVVGGQQELGAPAEADAVGDDGGEHGGVAETAEDLALTDDVGPHALVVPADAFADVGAGDEDRRAAGADAAARGAQAGDVAGLEQVGEGVEGAELFAC